MSFLKMITLTSCTLLFFCSALCGQELDETPPLLSVAVTDVNDTGLDVSLIISPSASSTKYSLTISTSSNLTVDPMLSVSFAVVPVDVSKNKWVEPNWGHIFTLKPVVKNNPGVGDEVTLGGGHTNPGDFPTDKLPIDGVDSTPTYTIPANPANDQPYDVTIVYTTPTGGTVTPTSGGTKTMWPKNWENAKTNVKSKNQQIKILVNQLGKAIHQDITTQPPKKPGDKVVTKKPSGFGWDVKIIWTITGKGEFKVVNAYPC